MADERPKPDPRVFAAYLDDVELELDAKLRVLEPLAAYATTYRYPSPTGKRRGGPSNDEVLLWIKTIAGLTREARIDLSSPAAS